MSEKQSSRPETGIERYFFRASAADLEKIPGHPVAYWASSRIRELFGSGESLEDITISDGQNITANNEKYLRLFWEVNSRNVGVKEKWFFYAKGGDFRKWWGNLDYVVDWTPAARDFYKANSSARIIPEYLWYKKGVTWTLLSSGKTGFRVLPCDATFDKTGSSVFFSDESDFEFVLSLLCSNVSTFLLNTFSSTIAYQIKEIRRIPLTKNYKKIDVLSIVNGAIAISEFDWNSGETSWDFTSLPLLHSNLRQPTLKVSYQMLRSHWREMTLEMQRLEEENNRIFIAAYVSHPGRSYGRLWNSCGWDWCHSFMACSGVLLLSADWGSWWLYKAT